MKHHLEKALHAVHLLRDVAQHAVLLLRRRAHHASPLGSPALTAVKCCLTKELLLAQHAMRFQRVRHTMPAHLGPLLSWLSK